VTLEADLAALIARAAQTEHADAPELARELLAARDLRDLAEAAYLDAGRTAHERGLTYAAMAEVLGLAGAGSAHFTFAPGKEARLARLRRGGTLVEPSAPADQITVAEAARRLGISTSTARRQIESGDLPAVAVPLPSGRTRWMISAADVPLQ